MTPEEQKEVLKQALKEWLDEKFAAFGKWSLAGICAALLFVIAYLWLITQGWTPLQR